MVGLIQKVRLQAELQMKRALMGIIGALLILVGGGFGVAAAWVALEAEIGSAYASLIIAAVFLGLGLLVLSLSNVLTRPPVAPAVAPDPIAAPPPRGIYRPSGLHPPVMEAFLLGLSVYLETKNRRR